MIALPAGVALAVTLLNLATWPRGRRVGTPGAMSVLIPARNEEATIEAAVRAALANPVAEVVVCDDASTDATPSILARLAREDSRVRVLQAPALPAGWVGKVHACHVLAGAARGEVLLFVDADVTLAPDGAGRVAALLSDHQADVLTAFPAQVLGSAVERLMLPLLSVTYTSWLPLRLVSWTRDPRFLAANGQVLAIRREALEGLGGFAAIRAEIVDDMALCRRAKTAGLRVVFADGAALASCRMYRSARELWDGFSKNLFEGLGDRLTVLAGVVGLYLWAFVLPYVGLVAGVEGAQMGVLANLALRASLAVRYGHPLWSVVAHPIAVLGLVGIAARSVGWWARGRIEWRGRTYAPRAGRA